MQNAEMVQRRMTTFRFSEEEYERLAAVAEHYALTAAGVIRMLVKREADAIEAQAPAQKRSTKKTKGTK